MEEESTFRVILPFEIAPKEEVSDRTEINAETGIQGVNILLVEDNALNIEIIAELLQEQGAKVTCAPNGQEAVELFATYPQESFEFILMDIMMPVMNGMEAAKAILRTGATGCGNCADHCPDSKCFHGRQKEKSGGRHECTSDKTAEYENDDPDDYKIAEKRTVTESD